MPTKLRRITINLPPHLAELVEQRAAATNRSIANYLADLISHNVKAAGYGAVAAEDAASYSLAQEGKVALAKKTSARDAARPSAHK